MYFNHRMFLKALSLALRKKPFRLRRWAFVGFFAILFFLFLGLVLIGRALDEVFARGYRRTTLDQPVFIIAPPRSGTSFLQKLLSLDEERFVHLNLYQTILPSVCFQRLVSTAVSLDSKLGGHLARLLGWCEGKWFGDWDDLHRMRLNQPEEDQALFVYAFAGEAIYMLFPFVNELWEVGFPDALPPDHQRRLMAYYRSCLQRHVYANGAGRTLLVKATNSCGAVESLLREFPDARFITISRHPRRSIASHVSLYVPPWQAHSPEIQKDGPEARAYAELAVAYYRHLFRFFGKLAPDRSYRIDYRELVRDPLRTVEAVYRHFGWSLSAAYRARLEAVGKRQRSFSSAHQYSLEEFGLSEAWIEANLGEVIAAYGLDDASRESAPAIERSA